MIKKKSYRKYTTGDFISLKFIFSQALVKLIKFSLYRKAKSHIYFLFPNRLHAPRHQWKMMVGNSARIKDNFSESAVRKHVKDFGLCDYILKASNMNNVMFL